VIKVRSRRSSLALALAMALGAGAATRASAQTPTISMPAQAPTTLPPAGQSQPAGGRPWAEIGFEHRFRWENWSNVTDYDEARDDRRNQFRFRTRLWVRAPLRDNLEVYAGLNNESRSITTPNQPTVLDEIFFEHLYVDWRIDGRHSLRVGRQNLMRGEGFAIYDANPLDGSRSAYFNALLFTRSFAPTSKIELMAVVNPYRDRFLPRIKDRQKPLIEWDEQALGAYFTEQRLSRTEIEAYFLHKTERNDYRGTTHPQYHPDRSLEIAGGRAVRQLGGGYSLTGELAGEWGRLAGGSVPIRAWGGYAYARKAWTSAWKPAVQAGYVAMSGDDPATATIEEWHPVFARWPKWSELLIYALAQERGPAYWTNLGMFQAEFTASPAKPVGLRITYYKLRAFHPFAGSPSIFGAGTDRGHLLQARLDFTLHASLRGHVLYEGLWPGDFTRHESRSHFFRTELIYTFRKTFASR